MAEKQTLRQAMRVTGSASAVVARVARHLYGVVVTGVVALAFAAVCLVVLQDGGQAEADSADSFAAQVDAAESLIRAGDRRGAMAELARLIEQAPLAKKLADYSRLRAGNTPGTRAWREELVRAGVPTLSRDELRAVHWFGVLSDPGVRAKTCRGDERERLLHLAALGGYPASQFRMGLLLATGTVCWEANAEESVHWYARAAEQGHVGAQVNLATALFLGQGIARDVDSAVDLLGAAAESGNPRAQYLLGVLYAAGDGVRRNRRRAIGFLQSAAEQGLVPAQTSLGQILWERAVSPEEWDEAREWLIKAAEQGDAEAQYRLGKVYTAGVDGEFWRFAEALRWFRAAAEGGHLEAQTALGLRYWEGDFRTGTMSPDHDEAVRWLRVAAEGGQPLAQTYLGYAYAQGAGVPEDQATAIAWWRKAAAQNESRAEEALGRAYENGRGVAKNVATARTWYRRAESHGSVGASQALQGSEFERLARDEAAIFATVAFFGAIVAAGMAERDASRERIDARLAAGGEWKSRYFCEERLWEIPRTYGTPDLVFRTICYSRNGSFRYADGLLDPCNGVEGWCDGVGLGPD